MKAIILAAGVGSRLKDLTRNLPKCLIKINGKSLLENQIELLERGGIKKEEISIVVGKEGSCWTQENIDKIARLVSNTKVDEFNISKGKAYGLLKGIEDLNFDTILIIDGDLFLNRAALEKVIEDEGENVALVKKQENNGTLLMNSDGNIIQFSNKLSGERDYIYSGMMKIGSRLFYDLKEIVEKPGNWNLGFTETINELCKNHEIKPIAGRWININEEKDIELAECISRSNGKGVIWDFDGVIVDNAAQQITAYKEAFKKFGLEISDSDFLKNRGKKNVFQTICIEYNVKLDLKKWLEEKKRIYWNLIEEGIEAAPGVKSLIESLYREGYKQAIASSTSRANILFILKKLKLRDYFEVIISSEDVKNGKPDPEPFNKAKNELGLKSSDCIVIEDSSVGILAAKRAGIKCIAINTSGGALLESENAIEVTNTLENMSPKRIYEIISIINSKS